MLCSWEREREREREREGGLLLKSDDERKKIKIEGYMISKFEELACSNVDRICASWITKFF